MSSNHGPKYAWTAEGRYEESLRYSREAAERSERYRADAQREKTRRDALRLKGLQVDLQIAEADLSRIELEIAHLINTQLPSFSKADSEPPPRFMQECYFCAESISVFARVCRYCKQIQPDKAREFFQKQLSMEKVIKNVQATY